MIGLVFNAFRNQFLASARRPLEFLSSVVAVILNNSLYLYGIYLLAILSIGDSGEAAEEYLVSTAMVLTSWGLLNLFGGGLFDLSSIIESGELETYLVKPRSPIFLVAISKSNLSSIGEVIQGIATFGLISYLYSPWLVFGGLFCSVILIFAFAAVLIIIGTLSFFSSRGSQLSHVLLQVILSLSLFPVSRSLKGREKWILYFTPLLITATLPRLAVFGQTPIFYFVFLLSMLIFLYFSLACFNYGLKHFQSKNYISING